MAQKVHSLSHTKWMCKYHIVFTPKYRRKVIYNQYRSSLGEIFHRLCSYKGVEIIEGHLIPDHVHMLVSIPPRISVSSFVGYLKGKSALMMFDKHANLKYKFGNRHFWAEGYYVSTVGLNEATIKKYIQEQEKHDIALDKLSVKEYEFGHKLLPLPPYSPEYNPIEKTWAHIKKHLKKVLPSCSTFFEALLSCSCFN